MKALFALTVVLCALTAISCGGSAGRVHIRVRNQSDRPATLWANLTDSSDPSRFRWKSVGEVSAHNDGQFDLDLSQLGPDKNIRLQPGSGPVQMTELSKKTLANGNGNVLLTMRADERMDVDIVH